MPPRRSGFLVDPEDWTSTLTQAIGVVPARASTTLAWSLQPISAGSYAIYAVALSTSDPGVGVSNAATALVASNRPSNPEGVLPAVIGGPVVFWRSSGAGIATLVITGASLRRRRRLTGRSTVAPLRIRPTPRPAPVSQPIPPDHSLVMPSRCHEHQDTRENNQRRDQG